MKVLGRWLTSCPVDLGEFSLRANWDFLSPRAVHSSSSVLEKSVITNRNRTESIMSPCFTPTLKSIYVSILTMMSFNTPLLNMRLIAENILGGGPYFPSLAMSSAWLEASKALYRSANAIYVGRLCFCLRCRSILL